MNMIPQLKVGLSSFQSPPPFLSSSPDQANELLFPRLQTLTASNA